LTLYVTLVRSRLEYASVAWNMLTCTDASKLECIQRKFLALFHSRFFSQINYTYVNALDHLNLYSLYTRRRHLDALFLANVIMVWNVVFPCLELMAFEFLFEMLDIRFVYCCFRPSARCASDSNTVCKDIDMFRIQVVTINHTLN
jgi:hypothetical protein